MENFAKRIFQEKIVSLWREQEERMTQKMAKDYGIFYIDLIKAPIDIDALTLIPMETAEKSGLIPFQKIKKRLALACLDPENPYLRKVLQELQDQDWEIQLFLCSKSSFQRGMKEYQKLKPKLEKIVGKVTLSNQAIEEIEKKVKDIDDLKIELERKKDDTTSFVEVLLGGGVKLEASDIHIIPEEDISNIRYRLDGIMHPIFNIKKSFYQSLLYRIKLLSGIRINIQNIPQDGRFTISILNREIEVRVSTVPGAYGENIVMRILDPKMLLSLEELGLHSFYYETLIWAMKKPQGMILTTGPTGSGKTTTLYACLKKIATPEVKVITIEQPIEYHLEGIDQTQANPEKGYGFAEALRAALRQDPDIILVGEIRDQDTAATAIQAALTGHLVFSTLHTNDAAGIVPRLIEMGITPSSIPPALNLGIAQRLLRRVCKKCAKIQKVSPALLSKIEKNLKNLPKDYLPDLKNSKIYLARGCSECHFTGYKGRIGIYEMFKMTPKIEEIINLSPSISQMQKVAQEEGMITMQQDGLLRVIEGLTTLDELQRITGPLEY